MNFLDFKTREGRHAPALIECLVITAGAILIGFFFFPGDPLFIHAPFPWIWFASVLIAFRYGFGPSLLSVVIIALAFAALQAQGYIPPGFPKVFFIGGLMLTMLCGQFSSLWAYKLRRTSQLSEHAQERLEQISRAYYLLRLSHDRLEQNLIIKPVTLRGAIADLRRLLALHGGRFSPENARRFMFLLAQNCSIESASLHLIDLGEVSHEPLAVIGHSTGFFRNDKLVEMALEKGVMSYRAVSELSADENSNYLVAAPIRVSNGETLGLLLIDKMPFMSLNRENLQVLSVLLCYFADQIHATGVGMPLLKLYPDCPPPVAAEAVKLARLKRDLNIDSAIVAIGIVPHNRRDLILSRLERQQRGLDFLWRTRNGDVEFVVSLLPFTSSVAVEGYLSRVAKMLENDFNISLEDPMFRVRYTLLSDNDIDVFFRQVLGDPP